MSQVMPSGFTPSTQERATCFASGRRPGDASRAHNKVHAARLYATTSQYAQASRLTLAAVQGELTTQEIRNSKQTHPRESVGRLANVQGDVS